jgi:hypothetical protein
MTGMKKLFIYAAFLVSAVFLLCGSKSRQTEAVFYDDQTTVVQMGADTLTVPIKDETSKAGEKSSSPANSSSSHSHRSSNYENMRGFDPASEDDMDDKGMSRYMENNDEEGCD